MEDCSADFMLDFVNEFTTAKMLKSKPGGLSVKVFSNVLGRRYARSGGLGGAFRRAIDRIIRLLLAAEQSLNFLNVKFGVPL